MQPREEWVKTTRPTALALGHTSARTQLLFSAVAQELRHLGQALLRTPGEPTKSEMLTCCAPSHLLSLARSTRFRE